MRWKGWNKKRLEIFVEETYIGTRGTETTDCILVIVAVSLVEHFVANKSGLYVSIDDEQSLAW